MSNSPSLQSPHKTSGSPNTSNVHSPSSSPIVSRFLLVSLHHRRGFFFAHLRTPRLVTRHLCFDTRFNFLLSTCLPLSIPSLLINVVWRQLRQELSSVCLCPPVRVSNLSTRIGRRVIIVPCFFISTNQPFSVIVQQMWGATNSPSQRHPSGGSSTGAVDANGVRDTWSSSRPTSGTWEMPSQTGDVTSSPQRKDYSARAGSPASRAARNTMQNSRMVSHFL